MPPNCSHPCSLKGSWLLDLAITDDEDPLSNLLVFADEVMWPRSHGYMWLAWPESLVVDSFFCDLYPPGSIVNFSTTCHFLFIFPDAS